MLDNGGVIDAASILQRADAQLGFGRIGVIADVFQELETLR